MSEAPKEIWCDTGLYWDYKDDWSEGSWRNHDDGGIKYIRADRIEELEAKLAKAEIIIRIIASDKWNERLGEVVDLSCEYLAELKGEAVMKKPLRIENAK